MKFGISNNEKVLPQPGLKALCPICFSALIARCGTVKIWHWAHKSLNNCDPWWENETEWHRQWKDNYPVEWQEIILRDTVTNEKHIADVRNERGLVLEFQHSAIASEERISREMFYKNMIWVVDGSRLKRYYNRFEQLLSSIWVKQLDDNKWKVTNPEYFLPKEWLDSTVPVVFDFSRVADVLPDQIINYLWCIKYHGNDCYLFKMEKEFFVRKTHQTEDIFTIVRKNNSNSAIYNYRNIQTHVFNPRTNRFTRRRRL